MGLFCHDLADVVSVSQGMAFVGYMAVRGFLPVGSEPRIGFNRGVYLSQGGGLRPAERRGVGEKIVLLHP